MAHYLIAHLNGGRYGSSAGGAGRNPLERRHRRAAPRGGGAKGDGRLGGGSTAWDGSSARSAGRQIVSHGGNVPDFSSYMALLPEQKKGVVLLSTPTIMDCPSSCRRLGMGVTALLAGEQPPPIRLGFIPWVMRASAADPACSRSPAPPPRCGCCAVGAGTRRSARAADACGAQHILLPLIPNLSLAALLGISEARGHAPLPAALYARPFLDRHGSAAALPRSGLLRTGLILRACERLLSRPSVGRLAPGSG